MTWRDKFRPIIARVLAEHEGQPMRVTRRALRAAYPCDEYMGFCRKAWLSEIRVQLGLETFGRKTKHPANGRNRRPAKGQTTLFKVEQ